MGDLILVRDLLLRTIIGINEDERHKLQDVVIDITVETDTHTAGRTDDVRHAVNYRTITKQVVSLVQDSRFFLVEKLAEEIARICLTQPRARSATVHVAKPGAVRFARSVGVEIHRERVCPPDRRWCYLLLGSNLAPVRNLQRAVEMLGTRANIVGLSPVYETDPVGTTEQPTFLNAVCRVETELDDATLRQEILRPIEQELGRGRTTDPNGPRAIDLDLVVVGQGSISAPTGRLIDPRVLGEPHAMVPLADLAPSLVLHGQSACMQQMAASLDRTGIRPRPDIRL
ncbi:MAG: 2-amino-4-hydroxy-6-hydroxymethyldihydropteridine diphosphokinase [Anaerolineae bacterium]